MTALFEYIDEVNIFFFIQLFQTDKNKKRSYLRKKADLPVFSCFKKVLIYKTILESEDSL
jgi:hypothetical protein